MPPLAALFILTLLLSGAEEPTVPPSAPMTGVVRERVSGKPIPNARIEADGQTAQTDERGEFLLYLPPGERQLRVSADGFSPALLQAAVSAGRVQRIEIRLDRSTELAPVRVALPRRSAPPRSAGSAFTLRKEAMLREVGAAWDIQRVMGAMPGAAQTSDMTNNIAVRGGNPSENLIRVDHMELPTASHLSWQGETGGSIGLVNLDFVRHADFYTGAFPAQFGGKLSSALDIAFREGNRRRLAGEMELSIGGFGGGLEGPLPSGNGSWAASARRSFLSLIREPLRLAAVPEYEDAHAKIVLDAGASQRIALTALGGRSNVDVKWVRNTDRVLFRGSMTAAGATWTGALADNAAFRATLSHTRRGGETRAWQPIDALAYENNAAERETALEAIVETGDALHGGAWQAGLTARRDQFRHQILSEAWRGFSENEGRIVWLDARAHNAAERAWKVGAFLHRDQPLGRHAVLRAGARASRFSLTGAGGIAPRASLQFSLPDSARLSLSAARHRQDPTAIELTLHESNRSLQSAEADHFIFSLERPWSAGRLLVEAYEKRYRRLPVLLEGEGVYASGEMAARGERRASGVDLLLERRGRARGSVQLSLSRVWARDSAAAPWHRGDFDYRRAFTAEGGAPLRGAWRISGKWRFVGGRPFTQFSVRALPDGTYEPLPDPLKRNLSRYPNYSRLDARIDRRFEARGWGASLFLEVQNILNRENVFARHFSWKRGVFEDVLQFKRLALIGLIADF